MRRHGRLASGVIDLHPSCDVFMLEDTTTGSKTVTCNKPQTHSIKGFSPTMIPDWTG